ncbi:MAG: winged helix-turn-helix domain-containing protein [Candidatus Eremiobacteraeota bacterium]|nr:winged helix-turn-helix domain-containing protein [Candidatus Eremiobacteraeota bacterium]
MQPKDFDTRKWRVAVIESSAPLFGVMHGALGASPRVSIRALADGPKVVERVCAWDPDIIFVSSTATLTKGIALAPILRQISRAQVIIDVPGQPSGIPSIEGPGVENHQRLSLEDLRYDPERRLVERGNRVATVTRREGMLLELLLRNAEVVLTPQQLSEAVWGGVHHDFANLRTHLHNMRAKVDAPSERRLLHTVRGTGYVLSKDMPQSVRA